MENTLTVTSRVAPHYFQRFRVEKFVVFSVAKCRQESMQQWTLDILAADLRLCLVKSTISGGISKLSDAAAFV